MDEFRNRICIIWKFDVNTLNPFRIFFNTHLNPITENLALSSRYFAYLLYFYFQETMANGITYHIQKTLWVSYLINVLLSFMKIVDNVETWLWLFIAAIHDLNSRSLESVMTCHLIWSYLNRNSDISIHNHENQQAHITLLAGLTFSSE